MYTKYIQVPCTVHTHICDTHIYIYTHFNVCVYLSIYMHTASWVVVSCTYSFTCTCAHARKLMHTRARKCIHIGLRSRVYTTFMLASCRYNYMCPYTPVRKSMYTHARTCMHAGLRVYTVHVCVVMCTCIHKHARMQSGKIVCIHAPSPLQPPPPNPLLYCASCSRRHNKRTCFQDMHAQCVAVSCSVLQCAAECCSV